MKLEPTKWHEVPVNAVGEEDWSKSRNGGNYAFGTRSVIMNGKKIGGLFATSSGLSYCEVTGNFTDTELIEVGRTGIRFYADKNLELSPVISETEFISLVQNTQQ